MEPEGVGAYVRIHIGGEGMKRNHSPKRIRLASVVRTLLILCLSAVVLWYLGQSVVSRQGSYQEALASQTYITTDDVNLRRGPGTTHEVLAVLPVKTGVAVTGTAQHGFLPVAVSGQRAWVSADFVAPEGSVLSAPSTLPDREVQPEPTMIPDQIPAPVPTEAPVQIDAQQQDVQVVGAVVESEPVHARTVEVVENKPETATSSNPVLSADIAEPGVEEPASGERWVEIDRTRSTVALHEGDHIVAVYDGLMGKDPSQDGYYATAIGTYHVFSMERELTETPFAPGVFLTHWVGFDPERSNGIHSPVRDAQGNVVQTGGMVTLGCVRLGADEAAVLYDFAFIGMRVEVHD